MADSIIPIVMPKWGLAMKEGSVTSWLKNEGDKVNKGETFVEIETEKVVNEFYYKNGSLVPIVDIYVT